MYGWVVTPYTAGIESSANRKSVVPIATNTMNSGVSIRRPLTRVTMRLPSYRSVSGSRRRASATTALSLTEGSSSRWRNSCTAVAISPIPKIRNMNENVDRRAAPTAMKIARSTSARTIPTASARD